MEEAGEKFTIPADARGRMEEPLPVRLVAVADVRVPGPVGMELELTKFYAGLWEFEREEGDGLVFRAENFRLVFEMREGLVEREGLRPVGVEVRSLAEAGEKLMGAGIEYVRQKGMELGSESILVQDPAGNWVELVERREI